MRYTLRSTGILSRSLHRCAVVARYSPQFGRSVATWTPLAAAFNRKPEKKLFSIFNRQRKGLFGNSLLGDPSGFYLFKEQADIEADRLVREATSSIRTRNVVEIFDDLSNALCRVADMAECIRVLHGDSQFAASAEEASSAMNDLVENLNTNRPLYMALKKVVDAGQDVKPMDDIDRYVARLFLVDFEAAGIHLEERKRKEVVKLNAKVLAAGMTFSRRCYEPHYVDAGMIPDAIKPYFHSDGKHIVIGNLMSDAPNEAVREAAYRVFLMPDQHQLEPLQEMLTNRFHLAKLVGFSSHSDRISRESVLGSAGKIEQFLETLSHNLRPHWESNKKELLDLKRQENPRATSLYPWDTTYLMTLARSRDADTEASQYMSYFPLGACMDGLSRLFESIYDVHFVIEDASDEDLWAADVYKLSVRSAEDEVLGLIYCDLYQRPDKSSPDCHFSIQGGRRLPDGSYQIPKVVLSLNYEPPQSGVPCLMNFDQIDNLFHEMGHAMHSMLGRTRYQHVTGTRTSTDFAEIPSTIMEYFSSDPRVLSQISRHYASGEALPESLLGKVCAARRKFSALDFQLQTLYAVTDQRFHGSVEPKDLLKIFADLHDEYAPFKYVPNTAWPTRFGHLFPYGGRYYSYLLARAVASDIWGKLFKADPFSREAGRKFRDHLLSHGGGRPPLELISNTLEHTPTVDEFVEALIDQTKV
ncbi:Mitochondrial intermediate peptidase [Hypsibius exemplaris]|uniref:Mitochondrial intermediate peptidase n=1 Tax=Hypsibius exemplaris TaxID=2072580 RepID=A0A1W0X420_HYPEX|nr:Mitochondrial intermediate peptidase [Hypsibius exemplaris]